MFCILAVIIIGSAIVCVFTKRIMRAATFLLFVLFGVAGVYFLLDYTFLGTAQIAIYAGGLTMLYIFAIQLVSKRTLQGLQERRIRNDTHRIVIGTEHFALLHWLFRICNAAKPHRDAHLHRVGAQLG